MAITEIVRLPYFEEYPKLAERCKELRELFFEE